MNNKIGVLGGMGPLATTIFMRNVILYTDANKDQENVPMVIINDTEIPDRTEFLTNISENSPYPKLINNIKDLEKLGCNYIVIICNTSHAFYEELQKNSSAKIINMIEETLKECDNTNFNKVGLLATEGTIKSKIYDKFNKFNIELFIPNYDIQKEITSFIYDYIKKDKKVSKEEFERVLKYFYNNGCDGVILGCTELSVIYKDLNLNNDKRIVDSTVVVAKKTIEISGKKLRKE